MIRLPELRRGLRAGVAVLAMAAAMTALAPATSAIAAPRRADLAVTAVASSAEVPTTTGGTVTFYINLYNVGRVAAGDVTATITLPPGAELAGEGIYPTYWQCDLSATPTWSCAHPPLAPDEQAETLYFSLRLPPATAGDVATVGVTAATSSREVSTGNNTAQATVRYVTPVPPDLAVGMGIVPAEVIAGGTVYFQIDLRNVGAGSAPYALVDLPVPANVDAVSPSTGSEGWDCSFGRDVITDIRSWNCSRGPLAAGEAATTLVLIGRVTSGSPGDSLTFMATARPADFEESTGNNAASASVGVVQAGTIRGLVWSDWDRNGQRGPDELGVSGGHYGVQQLVFVPQAPAPGDPTFIEAAVDSFGRYAVALKPGPYVVQVWVEVNFYDFTAANVGDDATDSDIVTVESDIYRDIGSSAVIDVVGGGDITVDAGLIHMTVS